MKQTILAILIATATLTSCSKSEQDIVEVKVTNVSAFAGGIVTLDKPLSGKRNFLFKDLGKECPTFNGTIGQKLSISRYFWVYKQYNP